MESLILVDKNDNQIGVEEKMKAHEEGKLHRAFSVFVFNSKNELIIQQRALDKYHCGGLWANTCCSHPKPGEKLEDAAHRRLREEMGFDCELKNMFHIIYKASFDNGLIEHELDHVFFGKSEKIPKINKDEVENWKVISRKDLLNDLMEREEKYAPWFKILIPEIISRYIKI